MLPIIIFTVAALPILILQLGLILGMPWGKMAMGGQFGDVFPTKLRISAAIQLLIIVASLLVVFIRGGVICEGYFEFSRGAIWFVVILYFISSILNMITSSKQERLLGAPCAIILFMSSVFIAVS